MRLDGPGLRRLRELSGHHLATLSAASGVSISYISEYERGRPVNVSGPIAKKLADALGVTVADLAADEPLTEAAS